MSAESNQNNVGTNITLTTDSWRFSDAVANFEEHIRQSVPNCEEQREFIAGLARFFLHEGATAIEIGVSTGALAKAVLSRIPQRACRYIGLDIESGMVDAAQHALMADDRFQAQVADATTYPFATADLILSYYSLQFIPLAKRAKLLMRAATALKPGGGLILYEKTLGGNARVQDILSQLYFEFKAKQGLSSDAILNKMNALQGISMPVSFDDNQLMLREAGFSSVEVIFRAYSFAGFLATKD